MIKRIGLLTSGGDCQALNATMRGVVKGLTNSIDDLEVYGFDDGYKGLIYGKYRMLTSKDFSGILTLGGTILGTSRCPFKLMRVIGEDGVDKVEAMKNTIKKRKLDCLVILGGNGTHKTANLLRAEGVNVVTLPKTIDNDLLLTDHTPGYGSAAKYIATILKEVICDSSVYDLRSVTVAEIMGRHTGWLAAAASLAAGPDCNGPDLILLPERPFDEEAFLARVAELEKERHNVIIAASEGVKNKDGVFLCDLVSTAGQLDAFGHKAILSGTSRYLADLIRVRLGCKTRAIEFSTLQRCASHLASRTDVTEAYQVGGAAVEAAMRGETAKMAAIKRLSDQPYRIETKMVDVTQVANFEKKVPDEWITADGMHVNANFERYARPLIQAELTPIYINGVPRHIHLD